MVVVLATSQVTDIIIKNLDFFLREIYNEPTGHEQRYENLGPNPLSSCVPCTLLGSEDAALI